VGDDEWVWDDIPVAELTDERPPRSSRPPRERRPPRPRRPGPRALVRRGPRSRRFAAAALAAATVLGAGLGAQRIAQRSEPPRIDAPRPDVAVSDRDRDVGARTFVFSALQATTASSNFHIRYRISARGAPGAGTAISGTGVVSVTPTAMVTTADVPGLGPITTRIDGTDVWEQGGGNYGMSSRSGAGTGAPLSQFAPLVLSTLGARQGAIAMDDLARPTGYLDLSQESVTAASSLGPSQVDGRATRDYEVSVDTTSDDRHGRTAEEAKTSTAAHAVLRREGYLTTKVRLSIDGAGLIRRARSETVFADGGTVEADATFSDFGCSTTVLGLDGPTIVPDASANGSGCPVAPVPAGSG
jgi:hypothetical protein